MPSPSPTTGVTTIRVRYAECDPMGVAHHTAYPVWFEMGRTELCRAGGVRYRDLEAEGVLLAVTALSVRYRAPARYDDELELTTTLSRMTRVKLEHVYELRRDGEILTTAETTLACLGTDGRPRLLPDGLASWIVRVSQRSLSAAERDARRR